MKEWIVVVVVVIIIVITIVIVVVILGPPLPTMLVDILTTLAGRGEGGDNYAEADLNQSISLKLNAFLQLLQ